MHEQLSDVHQIIRSYNGVARYLSTHFQQKCGRPCEWLTVGLPYSYHNLYLYLICQWQLPVWYCSQSTAEDAQKRVHIYIYIYICTIKRRVTIYIYTYTCYQYPSSCNTGNPLLSIPASVVCCIIKCILCTRIISIRLLLIALILLRRRKYFMLNR